MPFPMILLCIGRPRFTFSSSANRRRGRLRRTVMLFVFATRMTTAANAIFLQYTAPIYVALIGRWYLGERASRIDWLVIAVALIGIALFFFDRLTVSGWWGNIIALGSGLAFASVALFLRKEKAGSPVTSIVLGNLIVALAGLPFMLAAPSLGANGSLAAALARHRATRAALCVLRRSDQARDRARSDPDSAPRAGLESALGDARTWRTARSLGDRRWRARARRRSRPGRAHDANEAADDSVSRLKSDFDGKTRAHENPRMDSDTNDEKGDSNNQGSPEPTCGNTSIQAPRFATGQGPDGRRRKTPGRRPAPG